MTDPSTPGQGDLNNSNDNKPLDERVREVLEEMVNPALAMHGGFVTLVEVKDKRVFVQLGGGCQGCGMSQMTLKTGIETMLIEEVPEIEEVVDVTNHGAGANPFFTQE